MNLRSLLRIVGIVTTIGKANYLKAFIAYMFNPDYSSPRAKSNTPPRTIHTELLVNLCALVRKGNSELLAHDVNTSQTQTIGGLFAHLWFFTECVFKSLCSLTRTVHAEQKQQQEQQQQQQQQQQLHQLTAEPAFYAALRDFYEMFVALVLKYGAMSSMSDQKDPSMQRSLRACNQALAIFIKVFS